MDGISFKTTLVTRHGIRTSELAFNSSLLSVVIDVSGGPYDEELSQDEERRCGPIAQSLRQYV